MNVLVEISGLTYWLSKDSESNNTLPLMVKVNIMTMD